MERVTIEARDDVLTADMRRSAAPRRAVMPRGMPAAGCLPGVAPPGTAVVSRYGGSGCFPLAGVIEWVAAGAGRVTGAAGIAGG